MLIEERITNLEKRLRIYHRILVALAIGFVLTFFTGMYFERGKNTVKAKRFVLVDGKGNRLGEWTSDGSFPKLRMNSKDGKRNISLSMDNNPQEITGLSVSNQEGYAFLQVFKNTTGEGDFAKLLLGTNKSSGEISAGHDMAPVMNLNQDGNVRVRAIAQPNSSSVDVIYDGNEKSLSVP